MRDAARVARYIFVLAAMCASVAWRTDASPDTYSLYYRYTNPKPAGSSGDCYVEFTVTGTKVSGRLVDTRVVPGQMPLNTDITFTGSLTGTWESGRWLGEGDMTNGRISGTWQGRTPQHNPDMDRLDTYATSGRIDIFMGSSAHLRVLMGASAYEYNFRVSGRTRTTGAPSEPVAPPAPEESRAYIESIDGDGPVSVASDDDAQLEPPQRKWRTVGRGERRVLKPGDMVRAGNGVEVFIRYDTGATARMSAGSVLTIRPKEIGVTSSSVIFGRLWQGVVDFYFPPNSAKAQEFGVESVRVHTGIKGTQFVLRSTASFDEVVVSSGTVAVRHNRSRKVATVTAGQKIIANTDDFAVAAAAPLPAVSAPKDPTALLNDEWGGNLSRNLAFYNGNMGGVVNNGRSPVFTLARPTYVFFAMTYHYNGGRGAAPGTIGFRSSEGRTYGPFQARGAYDNKYWIVQPELDLPAGTYTVIDSDPATWSCNAQSGMNGHALIKGTEIRVPIR